MVSLRDLTARIWRDESGATAIEYAMIASLISIVIMAAMLGVNGNMGMIFDDIFAKVSGALTKSD